MFRISFRHACHVYCSVALTTACSGTDPSIQSDGVSGSRNAGGDNSSGGLLATGGATFQTINSGGTGATGGATTTGGRVGNGGANAASGGTAALTTGGTYGTGGVSPTTGGSASGGTANGGTATTGSATGGTSTSSGGSPSGGSPNAGASATGGVNAGGAGPSCVAWVRRLNDQCPEDDTFLGYTACATAVGTFYQGEQRHWEIDALATRPPAIPMPPVAVDCLPFPVLQPVPDLPTAANTYCDSNPANCYTNQVKDDPRFNIFDPHTVGGWLLVGVGKTSQGFMKVTVDQVDMGFWTYVVLAKIQQDNTAPEEVALYWNGFVRLKTAPSPGQDYGYGTSVVLGPFLPVDQDSTKMANPDLHPRIATIDFVSASLTNAAAFNGAASADAKGGWYSGVGVGTPKKDINATWHLSWTTTDTTSTLMKVAVDVNALNDIALPSRGLGYGSLSSMWANVSTHDSDTYSIGPKGSPFNVATAGSLDANVDTTPVAIVPADCLSFTTTTTTSHNSGSPDLYLQINGNSLAN